MYEYTYDPKVYIDKRIVMHTDTNTDKEKKKRYALNGSWLPLSTYGHTYTYMDR